MENADELGAGTACARALDTPVQIALDGPVTDEMAIGCREALQQARDANQKSLLVTIASDGGSVYACLAIMDMLRGWSNERPEHELITFATHAFSAAVNIFALGDRRIASPLATFMDHNVSGGCEGDMRSMRQNIAEIERVNGILDSELIRVIGVDSTQELCDQGDTYVDAKRAKELGLATQIGHIHISVDVRVDVREDDDYDDPPPRRAASKRRKLSLRAS